MKVWLGIDSSGTMSKMLAVNESKEIIKTLEGPTIHLSTLSFDEAVERIFSLIDTMVDQLEDVQIMGVGIGAPGGSRKFLSNNISKKLNERYPEFPVLLKADVETAHLEAFNDNDGILITVGNGSIVMGKNQEHWERAGGFGYLIGDWGSSYLLGQEFLQYVSGIIELNPESGWSDLLSQRLGLSTIEDVLEAVYLKKVSPTNFAPLLLDNAEAGDNKACMKILDRHLKQLSKQAFLVQQKLPGEVLNFAFCGPLATHPFYQSELKKHILRILPESKWVKNVTEPALGACRLIMNLDQQSSRN